jgi:DNA-binding NtrC family response regulator
MEALENHDWPGNIRELQNFIERAVIMTTGAVLRPRLAELQMQTVPTEVRTLADAERAHIAATLRETKWVGRWRGRQARAPDRQQRLGLVPLPRTEGRQPDRWCRMHADSVPYAYAR